MNKTLVISIAVCTAALAGCGHGETVVTGADGAKAVVSGNRVDVTGAHGEKETVTTSNNGTNMTVQSKDGSATYSQSGNTAKFQDSKGNSMETGASVTEQDLGLPFYPGSTESPGGLKATSTGGKGMVSSIRTTTDDATKVVAFYTDKLGKPKSTASMATLTTAGWEQPGNKKITLMIDGSASPAKITLMVSTGS